SPVGFGNRLDGNGTMLDGAGIPRPSNAFRSLASDHFNDWYLGLQLAVPLGYRLEHAVLRTARLTLAQSYDFLKDQDAKAKGTILQHNNVAIQEGPLPQVAMVRAVEHERERSKALVLRERPEPLRQPGVLAGQVPQDLPEQLEMPPAPANKPGAVQAAPVA